MTIKQDMDDFLDAELDGLVPLEDYADTSEDLPEEGEQELIQVITLEPGEIDPRLKLLSHSSRTTLHKCPRKYQLYRLSSDETPLEELAQIGQNVTFAYGTAVGVGVQSTLEGKTPTQIFMDTFLSWDTDLLDDNPKQKKSFWLAMFAVQKFIALRENGFLDEYELVYYPDPAEPTGPLLPAVELAFVINFSNGFAYRGFVDAVLRHKDTGEIMVLEAKTSSAIANPATFKNSGQALGYSVILDLLFPELSSYVVLYLVYETKSYEYKELPFQKSLLQRALWLQELMIDTQMIELYESYEVYPMHGESCFDFFRECEYLGLCTLQTENLVKPLTQKILDKIAKDEARYTFKIDFDELVETQIRKAGL
ncbi:MAG: hypothetical protein COB66_01385 [Coxiella sp. (in: Bacteria)]|nr:MAG: hypothetical protein COB66_01385 [Coxiella sp. (in: g-proteobacteria)]